MTKTTITIKPIAPFNFVNTVYSHGWVSLLPNYYIKENGVLTRVESLETGNVVLLAISGNEDKNNPKVKVRIESKDKLTSNEKREIKSKVIYMLRAKEDLSPFYKLCKKSGKEWQPLTKGIGRLLRSSTFFEDIVKVICTTNVQWGGTKGMIQRLIEFYGDPLPWDKSLKSFPTPERIAKTRFESFDKKVRMGYRSEYVHLLAKQIVKGELKLEKFFDKSLPSPLLKKELLKIKGIGAYAAASLMMSLERYDELPIDSVFRDFVKNKYFDGIYPGDKKSSQIYEKWGEWKFLTYWFDLWQFHNEVV